MVVKAEQSVMSTQMSPPLAGPRFGSTALETAVMLTRLNALLARAFGRSLAACGLSWPQAVSLLVLSEEDSTISATQLVERLGLGRTAMTSVVDRLERQGWVERRPSVRDRRIADLLLTDAGRDTAGHIAALLRDAAATYFAVLPGQQLATWQSGAELLVDAFGGVVGSDGASEDGAEVII